MAHLLGIDLGTQSVKALVYESQHRQVLAVTNSALNINLRTDGSAEQEATWWLDALRDCLLQIPESIRRSIAALSISGQQHGFVAMDAKGAVLCPVKLWCDTSTAVECEELMLAYGGEQACREQLGNSIVTGYTASKILWLKKTHPHLYARLATVLLPHDYLNFVLTGERVMEYGDASGTGLMNIWQRQWSSKMLKALDSERDLTACLPRLMQARAPIGRVLPEAAKRFGLPANIPVASGGGDNMMGAIGTGNIRQGMLTMSLGTSGTLYGYSNQAVVDAQGEIAAFCSSTGGWLPLFCTLNCTNATSLVQDLLGLSLQEFETNLISTEIGAGGIVALPFYQGERSPNLPQGAGGLLGLSPGNMNAANILRATVESVTFALRRGVERLQSLGLQATEIRLTGGGANSPAWRQLVADVCNRPVVILANNEGAAFGAALQALWMQSSDDLPSLVQHHVSVATPTYLPQPAAVEAYQGVYQRYCEALASFT